MGVNGVESSGFTLPACNSRRFGDELFGEKFGEIRKLSFSGAGGNAAFEIFGAAQIQRECFGEVARWSVVVGATTAAEPRSFGINPA